MRITLTEKNRIKLHVVNKICLKIKEIHVISWPNRQEALTHSFIHLSASQNIGNMTYSWFAHDVITIQKSKLFLACTRCHKNSKI